MPFVVTKPPFPLLQKNHRFARGLKAAWLFNEVALAKDVNESYAIQDWTGSGNKAVSGTDGTNDRHIKWLAGSAGIAIEPQYVSSNQSSRVVVSNPAVLDAVLAGNEFTFSAWVYVKSLTALAGHQYIFGKNYNGGATIEPMILRINSSGALELVTTGVSGYSFSATPTGPSPSAGVWQHIVVTVSKADNKAVIYLNGVAGTARTITGTLGSGTIGNGSWLIGNAVSATGSNPFNGSIDHVMVWGRAISADAVRALYRDPYQMFQPEPLGNAILKANDNIAGVAIGSAAGTGTLAAAAQTATPAVGAATGTGTASATGLTIRAGAGSASGVGAAAAVYVYPDVTWNPNDKGANITLSSGNLRAAKSSGAGSDMVRSSSAKVSGKWYFEVVLNATATGHVVGIDDGSAATNTAVGDAANSLGLILNTGVYRRNNANQGTGQTFSTVGDIINVFVDLDNLKFGIGKNNVYGGVNPNTGGGLNITAAAQYFAALSFASSGDLTARFTAASQTYTPPWGFIAWDSPIGVAAGRASGTGTATGAGASTRAAAGSATGTSTVSATGATVLAGAGSAAGTGTASGVTTGATYVGSASGTGTAAAVGTNIKISTASAAGTSTVTGVGTGIFPADGLAEGTSTADASSIAGSAGVASGVAAVDGVGVGLPVTYLSPDGDILLNTWVNQNGVTVLYPSVDEAVASDADYIRSGDNPVNDVCRLSISDPPLGGVDSPLYVSYRYRGQGPATLDVTVRLMEGTTEIASWLHPNIGSSFVTQEQLLTDTQVGLIVNPANLFIQIEANAP